MVVVRKMSCERQWEVSCVDEWMETRYLDCSRLVSRLSRQAKRPSETNCHDREAYP